jgi:hypothetical protein
VAAQASRVLDRLIGDDYVQEQIGHGVQRLGAAYRRARMLRSRQAVRDKKLYDHVREAAAALTEAARRVAGKPEPEPEPERRSRRLPAVLILAGVATLVRVMHRQQQAAASGAVRPPATP